MGGPAKLAAIKFIEESRSQIIPDESVIILERTASDYVDDFFSKVSSKLSERREDSFPHIDRREMDLGRVLGRGRFCVVKELTAFHTKSKFQNDAHSQDTSSSSCDMSSVENVTQLMGSDDNIRYAVKKVSPKCRTNPETLLRGIVDLAIETRFLATLDHPNLNKMRATSNQSPYDEGYFLVIDRLNETLESKIHTWKTRSSSHSLFRASAKKKQILSEKLSSVHSISSVLCYMHSLKIIYRDLQPSNIGFDFEGNLKIFDLGLARDLSELEKSEKDGNYNLTGYTGSVPYMSPEVAKCMPYSFSADAYSFGMIFWHIMEMEAPFLTYNLRLHEEKVVRKGYRPVCNKQWPKAWSDLMKLSWAHDPQKRPSFDKIYETLSDEMEKADDKFISQ